MSQNSKLETVLSGLKPATIEAHLRFLSDPLLEGRGAGARGGQLAEKYIEAVFGSAGLQPPTQAGFRNSVPMIGMTPHPDIRWRLPDGGTKAPEYRSDYVAEAGRPAETTEVDGELVYVGYGISAPQFGWDDFAGLDCKGKVLLIRVNDPGTHDRPDFFEGSALTYFGRWTYKFEEASRRGAAGAILIHTDESAGYGWNVVRTSNTGEQYWLAGEPEFPLAFRGWISQETAADLLASAGLDYQHLMRESETADFTPRPTGIHATGSIGTKIREVQTSNVIGLLPGSDPGRSEEPVILMAHHDHLGTSTLEDGRSVIYPGAHDNASGVALLLTLANHLSAADVRQGRPLLFLASTAEESGLLGSEWYARNPAFPLERTAAVLNVDGANLMGPTRDIAPLGVERSTLGHLVRAAAAAEGLEVTPEQHPEQGMFFRQDHFPFARAGVPAIAFDHGLDYVDKPEGWGEEWYRDFNTNHYHQPSDSFSESFDYRGAVQQARVMTRVALDVANADELPDWLPTATFARREGGG